MQIRNIRASVRHRHSGKFLTNYEALAHVEAVIYKYLKGEENKNDKENNISKN